MNDNPHAAQKQAMFDRLPKRLRVLWSETSPLDDPYVLADLVRLYEYHGEKAAINHYNRVVQGFIPGYTPIKPLRTKGREK